MRARRLGTLRRAVKRMRNRFMRGALILVYHRVAELPSDPQLLAVTPQHFAEHLAILRQYASPMTLQHLNQGLRGGKRCQRAVVVTFDDGYADNLHNAKPSLQHYEIPATVFVTTGYVGEEREFWWDELERLLLQPGALPETLQLRVNGAVYRWSLGEAADFSEQMYQRHRGWNVSAKDDPSPRHGFYRSLCRLLRPLHQGERRQIVEELLAGAGAEPKGRPTHRVLAHDELVRLAEGDLVEIGAHTVTHSVLSKLPLAMQETEIWGSKAHLEEILGRAVISFAYPFGTQSDYTEETVAAVREAGFACACSNFADVIWRGTDHYQLPRVLVRDWNGEEFARRLGRWLRG